MVFLWMYYHKKVHLKNSDCRGFRTTQFAVVGTVLYHKATAECINVDAIMYKLVIARKVGKKK